MFSMKDLIERIPGSTHVKYLEGIEIQVAVRSFALRWPKELPDG